MGCRETARAATKVNGAFRIGDYRVVYEIDDSAKTVDVTRDCPPARSLWVAAAPASARRWNALQNYEIEMVRIAAAVLAGFVAIGILVVLTDQIFAAAVPGFQAMTPAPPCRRFCVIVLWTDRLYSHGLADTCAP